MIGIIIMVGQNLKSHYHSSTPFCLLGCYSLKKLRQQAVRFVLIHQVKHRLNCLPSDHDLIATLTINKAMYVIYVEVLYTKTDSQGGQEWISGGGTPWSSPFI